MYLRPLCMSVFELGRQAQTTWHPEGAFSPYPLSLCPRSVFLFLALILLSHRFGMERQNNRERKFKSEVERNE